MTNRWFQGHLKADLSYQTLMFSKAPPVGYIKHLSIINSGNYRYRNLIYI